MFVHLLRQTENELFVLINAVQYPLPTAALYCIKKKKKTYPSVHEIPEASEGSRTDDEFACSL